MRDHHGGMRDHHGGARQFFEKIRFGLLKLRCDLVSVRKNQIWSVEIKVRPGQTVGEGAVAGLPGMNRPPLLGQGALRGSETKKTVNIWWLEVFPLIRVKPIILEH